MTQNMAFLGVGLIFTSSLALGANSPPYTAAQCSAAIKGAMVGDSGKGFSELLVLRGLYNGFFTAGVDILPPKADATADEKANSQYITKDFEDKLKFLNALLIETKLPPVTLEQIKKDPNALKEAVAKIPKAFILKKLGPANEQYEKDKPVAKACLDAEEEKVHADTRKALATTQLMLAKLDQQLKHPVATEFQSHGNFMSADKFKIQWSSLGSPAENPPEETSSEGEHRD